MIPVPENLYTRVDIGKVPDFGYRKLMEKEFDFCLGIRDGILDRVREYMRTRRKAGSCAHTIVTSRDSRKPATNT